MKSYGWCEFTHENKYHINLHTMIILVLKYTLKHWQCILGFSSEELTLSDMGDTSYSSKEIILSFFKFKKSTNLSPFLLLYSSHHIFLHLQKVKDILLSFR